MKFVISKIQHGGGRHFEKSINRHISSAVSAISTKSGMVTQFALVTVSSVTNLKFKEIQDGGGRPPKKFKNYDISATV